MAAANANCDLHLFDATTLRAAALALGAVSAEEFDAWVVARSMLGPRVDALAGKKHFDGKTAG